MERRWTLLLKNPVSAQGRYATARRFRDNFCDDFRMTVWLHTL